jgi:outer membrane scaffolding protein for murein synthesis (MipA/OmpV family)
MKKWIFLGRGLRTVRAAAAAALAAGAAPLLAQDFGPPPDGPMRGDFELTAGVAAAWSPAYLGSDDHRARVLPIIGARWSNGAFAGIGGIGWRLQLAEGLSGSVRLGADFGRRESASDDLRGMGDIDPSAELGLNLSWRVFGPWPPACAPAAVKSAAVCSPMWACAARCCWHRGTAWCSA